MSIISCPHCGNNSLDIGKGIKDREGYPTYIRCETCGACGPTVYLPTIIEDLEEACIRTCWNNRVDVREDIGHYNSVRDIDYNQMIIAAEKCFNNRRKEKLKGYSKNE
jgi:Lar family restriction alleviation protein